MLAVIKTLQEEFGTAVILITHDLGVIADAADDVQVMYAGAVMEKADLRTMFFAHHHPYTEGLLLSLPAYGGERERLHSIHGQPPSLISLPPGCPFAPRCDYVMDRCRTEVPASGRGGERCDPPVGVLAAARHGGAQRATAQSRGRATSGAG